MKQVLMKFEHFIDRMFKIPACRQAGLMFERSHYIRSHYNN